VEKGLSEIEQGMGLSSGQAEAQMAALKLRYRSRFDCSLNFQAIFGLTVNESP